MTNESRFRFGSVVSSLVYNCTTKRLNAIKAAGKLEGSSHEICVGVDI